MSTEPLHVRHADLERFSPEDSPFKSRCPHCKDGILLVWRDQADLSKLLRADTCVLCGKRVWYTDDSIAGALLYPRDVEVPSSTPNAWAKIRDGQ